MHFHLQILAAVSCLMVAAFADVLEVSEVPSGALSLAKR
jgi:hypothetical protein